MAARASERRDRQHRLRQGKHRESMNAENFSRGFAALGQLALEGVQVSARAVDLNSQRVLFSVDDHVTMPIASVGKVLLLIEVAARLTEADASGYQILDRTPGDAVADSGIWQHLQAPALPIADLAALVGATSDNLATNVLLRHIGLDAVRTRADSLGITRTALLDQVRDSRGPDDAPHLAVGSAKELTWLFSALVRGEVVDPRTSSRVVGWLSLNTDLSMVASAFGMDPLAHRAGNHGVLLMNKTGTDNGIRSEAGVLRGPRHGVSYAVTMQYTEVSLPARLSVLEAMRQLGLDLLEYVH
ncbi:serine hydrolase [Homoserinimonas sp. OAct 916]|uniref:serine hydrolase n=1 Tax=Homoserinimonas sp. OAct 916 TaxID=2211450 RepID=UPI000DBE8A61|nr:serine hydrolase [Homoserinimonas sp. OAct 916]